MAKETDKKTKIPNRTYDKYSNAGLVVPKEVVKSKRSWE